MVPRPPGPVPATVQSPRAAPGRLPAAHLLRRRRGHGPPGGVLAAKLLAVELLPAKLPASDFSATELSAAELPWRAVAPEPLVWDARQRARLALLGISEPAGTAAAPGAARRAAAGDDSAAEEYGGVSEGRYGIS